jgi:hypothetical protein
MIQINLDNCWRGHLRAVKPAVTKTEQAVFCSDKVEAVHRQHKSKQEIGQNGC